MEYPISLPRNAYAPAAAAEILALARSYLAQADRLIYSYGSRTFLSGYDLFDRDHGGRGNIDCSTFVWLVLAGIPYERSPYALGRVDALTLRPRAELDFAFLLSLPERYIPIAERIGHPELAGPKGLDLDKAAAMGVSAETLGEKIRAAGVSRRSEALAQQLLRRGECFADAAAARPGDLVFFRSERFFPEGSGGQETSVTHVGILSEDVSRMIHSSGYRRRERASAESPGAVALSPVSVRNDLAFYARPLYLV